MDIHTYQYNTIPYHTIPYHTTNNNTIQYNTIPTILTTHPKHPIHPTRSHTTPCHTIPYIQTNLPIIHTALLTFSFERKQPQRISLTGLQIAIAFDAAVAASIVVMVNQGYGLGAFGARFELTQLGDFFSALVCSQLGHHPGDL